MRKIYQILLISLFLPLDIFAQSRTTDLPSSKNEEKVASGYVFHDANGNSRYDTGEPGLSDVGVSNGTEIVLTDASGHYSIPVTGDTVLFVIKPKGWKPPVNEHQLPQFYYIHKVFGSPPLKYPGSPPTGPLPEAVNFPFYPNEEPDAFKVLVFADPQPFTMEELDYFKRDIVDEISPAGSGEMRREGEDSKRTYLNEEFLFGVSLGDIVGDDPTLFVPVNEVISKLGLMWYNVVGNHDINYDVDRDSLSDESWESVYGPPVYAFQYGKVHFLVLDDIIYPPTTPGAEYDGGIDADQFHFIENYVRLVPQDELLVLLMHIPLFNESYRENSFFDEDRRELFKLLKDHPHTLSVSGHTHTQNHYFFSADYGWMQNEPHHHYNVGTVSGSWWKGNLDERGIPDSMMRDGTPNGYAIFSFNGNDYSYDYKVANAPASYQMRIHLPKKVRRHPTHISNEIFSVNFFNGSPKARVEWRLAEGDGSWRPMIYFPTFDPDYMYMRLLRENAENPGPGQTLSFPLPSSHMWGMALPSHMSPGVYTVEVKATDMFGRIFTEQASYEIIE